MSILSRADSRAPWSSEVADGDRDSAAGLTRRILVPIDGRGAGPQALEVALNLARRDGAEVALLYVVDLRLTHVSEAGIPPSDLLDSLRREGRSLLLQTGQMLPSDLRIAEVLREGRPADEILAVARDWGADMIVLGRAGRTGWSRFFSSGTAEAVLRGAPCPVLVVRARAPLEANRTLGWRRMVRWARLKDEAGCTDRVPA